MEQRNIVSTYNPNDRDTDDLDWVSEFNGLNFTCMAGFMSEKYGSKLTFEEKCKKEYPDGFVIYYSGSIYDD